MKTTILYIAILISFTVFSQQTAQYNHYIFNQMVINPAYTGTKGSLNVNGIYSSQWTGINGAPTTQTISAEGSFLNRLGVGAHLIQDQIGAQSKTGFYGNYAFRVKINETFTLSMGIATGVTNNTIDGNLLDNNEGQYDPAIPENMESSTRFDSKAGIFLYGNRFYAGFSISELTANIRSSYDMLVAGQIQHYFLTMGYVFDISKSVKFKPGFLIKEDFRAPTNVDLNGFFLINNKFWIGGTYRTGAPVFTGKDLDLSLSYRDAAIIMTDINISDNFRVGYAYTFSLSALKDFPGHELSLGYTFSPAKKTIMLTPRYF